MRVYIFVKLTYRNNKQLQNAFAVRRTNRPSIQNSHSQLINYFIIFVSVLIFLMRSISTHLILSTHIKTHKKKLNEIYLEV